MQENSSELTELKSLLFDEEIDAFEAFEKRLTQLSLDLNDTEQVMARVSPLVDEILITKLEGKDDAYLEKYTDLLTTVINKSAKQEFPKLRQSLQSIISPAISKEIENNKDKMVDALYPIMGSMISKYVSQAIKEMMESINHKIEDGLSFDKYKRKAKAKLTGVSEAELLLDENSDAQITSLFVIQKNSGLLIAEGQLEDKEINDPHMVASMASAIKDFINDWAKNDEGKNEVQILSYAKATLYIESAGSVYIIAFLDAEPDQEQRREINTFFASLVKQYVHFFQDFNGDDRLPEVQTLKAKLTEYLRSKQTASLGHGKEKNPVKMILWILTLGLLAYGAYHFYHWYDTYSLERKIQEQTHQTVHIKKVDDMLVLSGEVQSIEDIYKIEKIIHHYKKDSIIKENLMLPMKYLDTRMKKQESSVEVASLHIKQKLENLEKHFDVSIAALNNKMQQMGESYETKKRELEDIVDSEHKIIDALDVAFNNNTFYDKHSNTLNFTKLNLFPQATLELDSQSLSLLLENVEKYITILSKHKDIITHLSIEAHSDSSGLTHKNMALSKQRAILVKKAIIEYYEKNDKMLELILLPIGFGSKYPIVKNGVEDKIASRRIEIKLNIEAKKIIEKIREAL